MSKRLEDLIWKRITIPAHSHDGKRYHKLAPDDRDVWWLVALALFSAAAVFGAAIAFKRLPVHWGVLAAAAALAVCAFSVIAVKTMWDCESRWQEQFGSAKRE